MKQVREDQLISEAYQTVSERTEFKPSNIVPDANTLTAFTSMLEQEGFPRAHHSTEVFNLLQNFLQTIPEDNQTTEVKKALQVALKNVDVIAGLLQITLIIKQGLIQPHRKMKRRNQITGPQQPTNGEVLILMTTVNQLGTNI